MLKLFYVVLVFIGIFLQLRCEWYSKTSVTKDENLILCKVEEKKAKLSFDNKLSVKTSFVSKLQSKINKVIFTNQTNGWVAGDDSIFKTVDGGKTWNEIKISLPTDAAIRDVTFFDDLVGWIIAKTPRKYRVDPEFKSWLFKTIDGGKTWNEVFHYESFELIQFLPFSQEQVLLIGEKTGFNEGLFFQTMDGGISWERFGIESTAFIESDADLRDQFPIGVTVKNKDNFIFILSGGRFIKTDKFGKDWQKICPQFNEPEQISMKNIKLTNEELISIWDTTQGIEGMWSVLAFEQQDGSWNKFDISDFLISEIIFPSNDLILVAGSLTDKKDLSKMYGVIIGSSDGGNNWSIIYKSQTSSKVSSLVQISSNNIIVSEEDGTIIRLSL